MSTVSASDGKKGKAISEVIWNQFIKERINRTDNYNFTALPMKSLLKRKDGNTVTGFTAIPHTDQSCTSQKF